MNNFESVKMTDGDKAEGETGIPSDTVISPVERRVRIIFWVEVVLLLFQVGQAVTIVIAATLFTRAFEDFIVQGLPNTETVRTAWIHTLVHFTIFWACIDFLIELALLVCLYRGMTQKLTRPLRRWMIFGWIFVFFIALSFLIKLILNEWANYSNIKLAQIIYSGLYGLYRTWANLVVLVFVDDIKIGLAKEEEYEIQQRRKEKEERMNQGILERRAQKAQAKAEEDAKAEAMAMVVAEVKEQIANAEPEPEPEPEEKKSDIHQGQTIYDPFPIPQSDNVVSIEI